MARKRWWSGSIVVMMFLLLALNVPATSAEGPGPTPVPRFEQPNNDLTPPDVGTTTWSDESSSMMIPDAVHGINYQSSSLVYTSDATFYSLSSASSGLTNSLQVWSDAYAKNCGAPSSYVLGHKWNSTWGTYVEARDPKPVSGCVTVTVNGTHLFDYGNNNFVYQYSSAVGHNW